MKPHMKRGLTRVALALMLAGYCAVPAAMAEDAAWVASGTTAEFEGTIPWLYREGGNATINSDDADHIKVTSDGKGTRPSGSETDKRLYSGDTITLGWDIGDTEGDIDDGPDGIDAKTTATIKWYSYSDNAGGGKTELTAAAGKTSYKLTDDERGRYIGVEIQPITQTGNPFQGTSLTLLDISTASGGGSDTDNVDPGPVVNQNLKVAIFEKGTSTNLIGGNTAIALNKTYVAKLYSDENQNGKYDAGTDVDVTANYDFGSLTVTVNNLRRRAVLPTPASITMTLLFRKLTNKQEPALTVVTVMVRPALQSRQTATAFRAIRCLSFTNTTNAHNSIPVWECCFPPVLLSDALSKTG